ncbi:hypothetical protein YC2023_049482 [Brassica napus]
MAAVTSLLSDGIHIGALVRGKKVRDENKENLGNLGFTLELGPRKLYEALIISNPTDSTSRIGVLQALSTYEEEHRQIKDLREYFEDGYTSTESLRSNVPLRTGN